MEANTAAATSHASTFDDQAPSSVHAQSLLPPLPPNLTSAFSPVMGDDASLSVQAHAAASPSLKAATHRPTMLAAGQPSSSTASPGLPAFLSGAIPGFAAKLMLLEQLAAWQRETPLVSPPPSGSSSGSGSDLPPPSGGGGGCTPPLSPDYELPPLPESLRIPELEEMSTQHNMSSTTTTTMGINSSSSFTPKLSVGANKKPSRLLHLPPWDDSADNANKVNFNKHEEEIISKDKSLQDLITTDPKKVKRLISYRVTSAKRKAVEDARKLELKHQLDSLQTMRDTKYAELQLLQVRCAELKAEHHEMSVMVQELDRQVMLKDAMSETLQAQIHTFAVKMSSMNIDETNVWRTHGFHQQNNIQVTDASGSHMNALRQQMDPDRVQLQQLQIQEQPSEHPQAQAQKPQQNDDDQFMV